MLNIFINLLKFIYSQTDFCKLRIESNNLIKAPLDSGAFIKLKR